MAPIIFVLGGARSGKSRFAEERTCAFAAKENVYVATAECRDEEMESRIALHRARRGADWTTIEAPHRLAETLSALASAFGGDRRAAVCRELTKTYEEVRRGTVTDLGVWAAEGVKGEITVVVQGAEAAAADPAHAVGEVLARVARGIRLKDAAGEVAAETGLSKKALYDAALAARG